MVRAVELYYDRGLGQREIATILGSSVSTVSRLLADARSVGIVEITINRSIEKRPELSERIRKEFGLRDAIVVADNETPENSLRLVGAAAAELLLSVLDDGTTVGITWGPEPAHVVEAIDFPPVRGVSVVQMVGSLGKGDPAVDGPELAMMMARRLGGTYRYVQAPAVVESAEVARLLMNQTPIRETLEAAARAKVMLSGIGVLSDPESGLERAGYITDDERKSFLASGAVGHMLARMFDASGDEIDEYNRRVVGLSFDALRRAEWSICVCDTKIKTAALRAALRGRLFNTLVVCEAAAQELLSTAAEPSYAER